MKVFLPKELFLMQNIYLEKPEFYLNLSLYAGFSFEGNHWLPQKELLEVISQVTEKSTFDNGMPRARGECLVYSDCDEEHKLTLKILDIRKKSLSKNFLALEFDDKSIVKEKGTFNDAWLKKKWPALPKDHKRDAFQIAPMDQRSDDFWSWGEDFYLKSNNFDGYSSLPEKQLSLFSLDTNGEFAEIELQLDLLWLLPDQKIGVLIAHGVRQVTDADASEVSYLYVTENELGESLPLADHESDLKTKIESKKPSFKPAPMPIEPPEEAEAKIPPLKAPKAPEIKMDPEVAKIKAEMDDKLAAIKLKYADEIKSVQKSELPSGLQSALKEEDPKVMMQKVKSFMDGRLGSIKQEMADKFPAKATQILNPVHPPIETVLAGLAGSITSSLSKAKVHLSADQIEKLPDPEKLIADMTDLMKKQDAKEKVDAAVLAEIKAKKKEEITYKDSDFSNQNLSNRNFTDCDVTNTNFSNSDLSGAIFNRTKIDGTIFNNTNLKSTSFLDLNIVSADFSEAIFKNAKLEAISFNECDFNQSNLSLINAKEIYWHDCNFLETQFLESSLSTCTFTGSKNSTIIFDRATVKNLILIKMQIKKLSFNEVNFEQVTLMNCEVENISGTDSNIQGFTLHKTNITKGSFDSAKIEKFSLSSSKVTDIDFKSAELISMRSGESSCFDQCNFQAANMTDASFMDSEFKVCEFQKANLTQAMLRKCILTKIHLDEVVASGVDFSGSDLTGAYIEKTNLFDASLYNCNLNEATFANSNLYGLNLYLASIESTVFQNNLVKENFELVKQVQTVRS